MAKRAITNRIYSESSYDDVEILGSTQGSCTPGILHFTASSRPTKRATAESSERRHRYNYRYNKNAEDGD